MSGHSAQRYTLRVKLRPRCTPARGPRLPLSTDIVSAVGHVGKVATGDVGKMKEAANRGGLRHLAGGSMSGAMGVTSDGTPRSSTCNLRSAALSKRAAEIVGSVVALANPNRIAA